MKKEDYIKKNIILEGCGLIQELKLDSEWFNWQEHIFGPIDQVLEINKSRGGIGGFFGSGQINGCIILFKNGKILCAESDGEYVDMFRAER